MSWLTHLVGSVVRTLLDYVSYVSICPNLKRILKKTPEWDEILDILRKKFFQIYNVVEVCFKQLETI